MRKVGVATSELSLCIAAPSQGTENWDAIDRFIVANYRPDTEAEDGTLHRLIFGRPLEMTRWQSKVGEGPQQPEKREVFYPPLLVERIEERWQELGSSSSDGRGTAGFIS